MSHVRAPNSADLVRGLWLPARGSFSRESWARLSRGADVASASATGEATVGMGRDGGGQLWPQRHPNHGLEQQLVLPFPPLPGASSTTLLSFPPFWV